MLNKTELLLELDFCKAAFKLIDKKKRFLTKKLKMVQKAKKGNVVAIISAKTKTILNAERTALNFLRTISGIATLTNSFVKKVKRKKIKICCTRKTCQI